MMKITKKILCYIFALSLLLQVIVPWDFDMVSYANQTGTITGNGVRLRQTPNGAMCINSSGAEIYLMKGDKITILDTTNPSWYKVTVISSGQEYTGYASSTYIIIDASGETPPPADATFEEKLTAQGFPESYKVLLRNIHAKYPNWEFQAVHTGLEWSTVVANEINVPGKTHKNLVEGTSSLPRYSWRSTNYGYDYKNDTWTPLDGSRWFAASEELIAYYLDPRTYLYENYIFVFESLSYVEGMHTQQGVDAVLAGTFMGNGAIPAGETRTYSQIIMEAAAISGVSPYHIASRIIQEVGANGNSCAFGTNSSYYGIYNFYNIGAYDGANAAVQGLAWASVQGGSYGRPWNTAAKSIIGGAQFIGASYIAVGQNTLYTQKFNVTNTSCLFSHQYMTNVQAPAREALTVYNAYVSNKLLDSTLVFKIPVYTNMPETAVSKPADAGNPNNWLSSLSVDGYVLSPAFDINMVTDYTLTVPETTESVNISGSTVNKNARISGLGTIALLPGVNNVTISVTAQNGNVRNYNLTVIRGDASLGNNQLGTSRGDLNGDNIINYKDIVKLQRIIMNLESTTAETLQIGDINKDGIINYKDIVKVQRHIMEIEIIQ